MDLGLAKLIVEVCDKDCCQADLYENYSGRGMHGATTAGVQVDDVSWALTSIINNADRFVREGGRSKFKIDPLADDSMGKGIILY